MTRRAVVLGLLAACEGGTPTPADPVCQVLLECPEPIEVACAAVVTPVPVPDASRCPSATTSDDRLEVYPLGETTLTFEARLDHVYFERTATCTTRVSVVDEVPPEVSCEDSVTLVRAAPDEPMPPPPEGSATDVCDDDVEVTITPSVLTEALTDVVTTATDGSGNVATCTTAVEVLDLFAVPDLRLLGATLDDGDDTVLTLGWEPPESADVDSVAVERGPSAAGPWEAVQVLDAEAQVVTVSQRDGAWYRLVSLGDDIEGGATEPIQVHAIARDAYDLRDVVVPTIPYPTTLYGVVRHPADLDAGPYPLVLLMHGNHGNCRLDGTLNDYCALTEDHECNFSGYSTTPNAEGLAYLAEGLAARGFIAVSVSANAMNCRSGYILERAQLLRRHLEVWADWASGTPGPSGTRFASRVDLARVGLVGHSRGGDAVSQVPRTLDDAPVAGVDVVSVFAIAPTDYNVATVFDTSWALLLPACDGDVSNLWGSDIYERSHDAVPHKSQVFFPGANHNFFNTEWAFDDGSRVCSSRDRVGSWPQTTMLQATLGPWMTRTVDDDRPEATQRAEVAPPSSLSRWAAYPLDLRWSYTEDDALVVDAFTGDPALNDLDGPNTYTGLSTATQCYASECGSAFLHQTSAVRLGWTGAPPATAGFRFSGLDTSIYDSVSLRAVSATSGLNDGLTEHAFLIIVEDADGNSVGLDVRDLTGLRHLYGGYNQREVLQTLRIPFELLEEADGDLDVGRIEQVVLDFGPSGREGAVTVTDVQLGY